MVVRILSLERTALPSCGGGVCIIANNNTARVASVALPPKYSNLELCVVDIISHQERLRLFVCYRPPSADCDRIAVQYVHDLCECMSILYPINSTVLICGYLNFPNLDWSTDCNSLKCSDITCSGTFLEFYYTHGLRQYVTSPTRSEHILDVVFSNDYNSILNIKTLEPFGSSDHCQVAFQVARSTAAVSYVFTTRDFKFADWAKLRPISPTWIFTTYFRVISLLLFYWTSSIELYVLV
jgi:hypothetical protein